VNDELVRRGGRLLAISVDPPGQARDVVTRGKLAFPVLCDVDRRVTRAYGLLHAGAGPGGSDVPVPAHVLVDRGGRIVWRRASRSTVDRPAPGDVLARIAALP
jgi:peroxiredoxin